MTARPGALDPAAATQFRSRLALRHGLGRGFFVLCVAGTLIGVVLLIVLLASILQDGLRFLSLDFLTQYPSRFAERAGFRSAILGSLWVIALVALFSFPLGVGAAVYLEEYAPRGRFTSLIQTNISNLAGVPSIVYGLLGLQVFVRGTVGVGPELGGFGRVIVAGSLTLTLLILPVVIVAAQEAIRAVPPSIREASYGLGATKWQTVWHHVLPQAMPGIFTGMILALSRAIGETAPLIMIGALTFVAFDPSGPFDEFTVMPIQIFNWVGRPQAEFQDLAASGIIVLLVVLLAMNTVAISLRYRFGRGR